MKATKKKASKKKSGKGKAKKARQPGAAKRQAAARLKPVEGPPSLDPRLLSRLRQLVARASFELRLADDIARGMRLDTQTLRPLRAARRHLSACLSKVEAHREARKPRDEGEE